MGELEEIQGPGPDSDGAKTVAVHLDRSRDLGEDDRLLGLRRPRDGRQDVAGGMIFRNPPETGRKRQDSPSPTG